MKKSLFFILLALVFTIPLHAYQFTFDGEAAKQYPIVIEVDRNANGAITGRYAYKSTLNSQGRDKRSSWLYIKPAGNSKSDYIITDYQGDIQERWTDAMFWRDGNVNYFSVSVRNTKGKTFGIDAHSTSKNTGSWTGTYHIHSDGYRLSPPPMSVFLCLSPVDTKTFSGSWVMTIADDNAISQGMFLADAVGTLNNGVMTIKLINIGYNRGGEGCYFYSDSEYIPRIENGEIVAKISKTGSSYKIQPIGKMTSFLTDLGGILTIVKTE